MVNLNKAVELDPSNARMILFRGETFADAGDAGKALEDYRQVGKLEPDDLWSVVYSGDVYLSLKQNKKAVETYTKCIVKLADDSSNAPFGMEADLYAKRAKAFEGMGDHDKAAADRQKSKRLWDALEKK